MYLYLNKIIYIYAVGTYFYIVFLKEQKKLNVWFKLLNLSFIIITAKKNIVILVNTK